MNRLGRSFAAETRKVFAGKLWWILTLVIVGYSAFIAATFAAMFGTMGDAMGGSGSAAPFPEGQDVSNMVYSALASFVYAIPLLFGALMATSEFRHKTLSGTFLAEPRRTIVFVSRSAVVFLFGIFLGLAGAVGTVGAGSTALRMVGLAPNLDEVATWMLLLRSVLALAVWALIGFGLGLLIKSQAGAIVVALVFTQFIEPLLRTGAMFWEWSSNIARFFPGAATDAFVGASVLNDLSALDPSAPAGGEILSIWQGGGVLLLLAIAVLLLGWLLRWRADV